MQTSTHRRPRRSILRVIALAALALVVGGASRADAAVTWCREDPVVKIDGQVADVFLSSDAAMNDAATGPAQIVVTLPPGAVGQVIAVDNGFGGQGYAIAFATSSSLKRTATATQVKVAAYAPASDDSLPLQVDFVPRSQNGTTGLLTAATASGTANAWVTLTAK